MITTGIHQSIDLAVRLLTDPGDAIWTEDPCYWGVRSVLNVSGLTTRPIPVDDEGIAPSAADLAEPPKLMLVTPSHQYPLGMVMSLARRRMLLEYARQHGCWIIEDDYDSEFRYGSRPLASLQGLDTAGQVIYVGSFGKTLFPGCGSVIWLHRSRSRKVSRPPAPSCIAKGSCCSRRCWPSSSRKDTSCRISARCARYMGSAASAARRVAQRRHAARARQRCGLHLVTQLPEGVDDRAVAQAALERNIVVRPLSGYYADRDRAASGLLLGYACVPEDEIATAFATLAEAIDERAFGRVVEVA